MISCCLDPCLSKVCGPYGQCEDSGGIAVCKCSDGIHSDNTPCEGKI
jgi:hypothetical protein